VVRLIERDPSCLSELPDISDPEAALFFRNATRYFQISSLDTGAIVTRSPEIELLGLSFTPEELRTIDCRPNPAEFKTDIGDLRFFDERITSPNGKKYFVLVGTSLEPLQAALTRFSELAFFLIPCSVVLAALGGWFFAGGAMAPIRRIARAVARRRPSGTPT
jgi:hypothetical protein